LTFSVSGADSDGDALTFGATDLPTGANFDPATQVFSWTPDLSQAGSYTVTFSVDDGNSGSDSRTVSITVAESNQTPTADAGADQNVEGTLAGGGTVTLAGSGSDPDGDPISFVWMEGTTVLSTAAAPTLNLSYGTHTLTLTVTDGFGASSSDSMTVTVADTTGPMFTDVQFTTVKKSINGLVLKANEALDPTGAANLANYALAGAGKDRLFGTLDDVPVTITSAVYDAATQTVRLTPATYLRQGLFYKLSLIGTGDLTDLLGNRLDGDMNGTSGDNCVVSIVRGTKMRYTDSDGDSVSLSLKGGGAMEMVRALSGDAMHLRLANTVSGVSTLNGSVKKSKTGGGDAVAKLKLLSGTGGVVNLLGDPPLQIESSSAAVVDLLLTSGVI